MLFHKTLGVRMERTHGFYSTFTCGEESAHRPMFMVIFF